MKKRGLDASAFGELLESIREGGAILRGQGKPSHRFAGGPWAPGRREGRSGLTAGCERAWGFAMLMDMKSAGGAVRVVVGLFATIANGAACTIVSAGFVPAGPTFSVRVEDRGRPVAGLPIRLKGSGFTKTVATRENGTAHFENIPPGTYQIGAPVDLEFPDGLAIQVTPTGPTGTTIPLTWPSRAPLAVQTLKGSLRWPNLGPDQPSKLQVELLDARTGRPERAAVTTGDGAFDLGRPAPGLYFLRVTSSGPVAEDGARAAGIVPIEVDPRAVTLELELEFSWTSCGMVYVPRHRCPRQELRIAGFSGQVFDSSGAAIAGATVRLFDTDREMAEQLASGDGGRFGSVKQFEGEYELVVSRPGFTPLRQLVRAIRPGEAARLTALRIELGVAGSCSQAAVR